MHRTGKQTYPTEADRKDQAIGRIIRLLPSLPVKELDAMADQLCQRINGLGGVTDLPGGGSAPFAQVHEGAAGLKAVTRADSAAPR